MAQDNGSTPGKKSFPGGIFLFFLASLLLILALQNISGDKSSPVSFSHQLEHLVNLDLLQKDQSQKVALNDNLVSFSGKFQEHVTEEGKARYRYLELLNGQHELTQQKNFLESSLTDLKAQVLEAADWFLHLTGISLPKGGYVIVSPLYDRAEGQRAIVLKSLSEKEVLSLRDLDKLRDTTDFSSFKGQLLTLIQGFRSAKLGIGDEDIKLQLKSMEQRVLNGNEDEASLVLNELHSLVAFIGQENQGVRLGALRSVRNYTGDLAKEDAVSEDIEKNTLQLARARQAVTHVVWFFNNKELSTKALEKQDPEIYGQWFAEAKEEWSSFGSHAGATFKVPDQPRTIVLDKTFTSEEPAPNYWGYLFTILPVLMVVFLLYFVFSRQMKGMGAGAMTFGKSPARLLTKDKNKVTFKDVAGCDEAKEELQEIVDFLKDPAKFTALGARIPKGVLCIGAPGTGKTLIAKAVAGEADRPFFSISGSDFVEMFVGVGASRIRDMFDQAKKNAPCIIFMDEIDAVGRHRGAGIGGGHDEREQTLNQLLVEMDGFDTSEGVILIAATNRPDVLDKALLRPGRFDRRIVIDLPDVKGRFEILKVHARKIKLDGSVDLMRIARNTPGASGADLENILNEAALLAARKGRSAVTEQDAAEACDKVRYGKERKSLEIDQQEKKTTAYHESGHAVVALVVEHADPVDKVTIIPRGLSLGATHFMPKKNRLSYWKKELGDRLAVLMGGRVAEEVFVGDISSGAQMDISQATRLVRSMVCEWGMTDALGLVAYDERSESGQYLGMPSYQEKNYSEETASAIDVEVRAILDVAHKQAKQLIESHREAVQLMADMLMEFETLDRDDVAAIMDGTWDTEKKRARVKQVEELHRKQPPPPPVKATAEERSISSIPPQAPQET